MNKLLGLNYRLEIEVLSPLHVGSGQTLMRGFDFEIHQGRTYRLWQDVILNDYWPDDPRQQELLLGKPLSDLLQPGDYRARPHYFAYVLPGQPALRELAACIKDPRLRPYLPGSSLKGALRTALMRAALARENRVLSRGDIGPSGRWGAEKRAGRPLEDEIFGPDPNNDLLRALRVGDSDPAPADTLRLTRLRMVPGLDVDVETIARGTRLVVPLQVDTYLLDHPGRQLRWPRDNAALVRNFVAACRAAARERLLHEYEYHAARRLDTQAASFYARLAQEYASGRWPKNEFLVQVGYAAGWRSKSVLGGAANTDPLLADVVHEFDLDRGGKRKGRGGGYVQGQPFPKARHLAYVRDTPALPMGWLRVRAVLEERERATVIHGPVRETVDLESPPPAEAEIPAPFREQVVPEPVEPGPVEPEPEEPEAPGVEMPPPPAGDETLPEAATGPDLPSGPYTGTVTYFNLLEGRGTVRLDEGDVEIDVLMAHLRAGVRYLSRGERVSLELVPEGTGLVPRDVRPAS